MAEYPTPHINAKPEDFAKTVLMPGDPLRAAFIAENYLDSPVIVNSVRGMNAYTGYYKGERVSVMASGMGVPSMGIYSYELYNIFGVENIIRIGSAGSMRAEVGVRDIVLAQGASTDSSYAKQYMLSGTFSPIASYDILSCAVDVCKELGASYHVGNVLTSDAFYNEDINNITNWAKMGVLCVEMETAALYMNAARSGKRALSILTISDSFVTSETTTAEERQTSFRLMMEAGLNTAIRI